MATKALCLSLSLCFAQGQELQAVLAARVFAQPHPTLCLAEVGAPSVHDTVVPDRRQQLYPTEDTKREKLATFNLTPNLFHKLGCHFDRFSKLRQASALMCTLCHCAGPCGAICLPASVWKRLRKRGKTCLNYRPRKSYACYWHSILRYKEILGECPSTQIKGKLYGFNFRETHLPLCQQRH